MTSMMILFWIAVTAAVVVAIRAARHDTDRRPSPQEVLDERFARGEITAEEYEHRRDVLKRSSSSR